MSHPGGRPRRPAKVGSEIVEVRRAEAVKLRLAGFEYRQIAKHLGVSLGQAHHDVHVVFDRTKQQANENAEAARQIELARCDRYLRALEKAIAKGSTTAIDTAVKVGQRRAKLLGLDMPEQVEAKVGGFTPGDIAAAVSQQFGSKGPAGDTGGNAPPDAS